MAELGGSDLDSDDELLNFQAFSNKKQKREINKDDVLTSRAPRTSRSGSKVEKTVSNETKALRIVSCASVPSEVRHPRDLYWHKEIKKRGSKKTAPVQWHPCRTCHPDDATGLNLPEKWDQSKKSLVQYIEGTGFKHLSLVGKSTLVPYHGKNDNEKNPADVIVHEWCSDKMNKLANQNRKSRKKHFQDEASITAMELYMKKVMKAAVERMQEKKKCQDSEDEMEQEMKPDSSSTECQLSSSSAIISQSQEVERSDHDEYSSEDFSNMMRRGKTKDFILRPGDQIAFYQPNMVHGDKRAYREAVIESIDCKKDLVITLQGGSFLDRDQKVRRIKKFLRGKLEDDDGNWTTVRDFKLASAKLKGPIGVAAEAKRLKEIVDRQKQITKEKLKEEGLEGFGGFLK